MKSTISRPRKPQRIACRTFRPSRQQLAYLACWLDPSAPKTVQGVAAQVGVERRTVYNWFEQPDFIDWFNSQVQHHTDHLWTPLVHRIAELALQGSVEHMRLFVQIRGGIRPQIENRDGRSFVVTVGAPRPSSDKDSAFDTSLNR